MTVSTNIETAVGNLIDSFGSIVTVVSQTATTAGDSYHQSAGRWASATTAQAHALILPPYSKTPFGEEFHTIPAGEFQEADFRGYFEATWTLEESQSGSTATITNTRYVIAHNSDTYQISLIKPWEIQNNVFLKFVLLKQIVD